MKSLLPKTYKVLTQDFYSSVLRGYNAGGTGIVQSMFGILTGKLQHELDAAKHKYSFRGRHRLNSFPFVWKQFAENGYKTLFGEDEPRYGFVNDLTHEFQPAPTHHYFNILSNYIESTTNFSHTDALISRPRYKILLDYIENFFNSYSDEAKFAFASFSPRIEDGLNTLKRMDNDFDLLLRNLIIYGHYLNTAIFFLSDHGQVHHATKRSERSKMEEKLPFASIYLPRKLSKIFPSAHENLRINSERLATPFDIHATLKDLAGYSASNGARVSNKAFSLFSEIPRDRTCAHAFIEPQWCACLQWEPLDTHHGILKIAAQQLVDYINTALRSVMSQCYPVRLARILSASLHIPYKENLVSTYSKHNTASKLAPSNFHVEEIYKIELSLLADETEMPHNNSETIFEAVMHFNVNIHVFFVKMDDIVRINMDTRDRCLKPLARDLKKFCICRHQESAHTTVP